MNNGNAHLEQGTPTLSQLTLALGRRANGLRLLLVLFSLAQSGPFILFLCIYPKCTPFRILAWEMAITVLGLMVLIWKGNAIHNESVTSIERLEEIDEMEEGLRREILVSVNAGEKAQWEDLVRKVVTLEACRRRFKKALSNTRNLRTESIRILILSFFAALVIAGSMKLFPALIKAVKEDKVNKASPVSVNTEVNCCDEDGPPVVSCPPCPACPSCPPVNVDMNAVVRALSAIADKLDTLAHRDPPPLGQDTSQAARIRDLERALAEASSDLSHQDALLADWYLRSTDPNLFARCRSRKELRKAIADMLARQMPGIRDHGDAPSVTPMERRKSR